MPRPVVPAWFIAPAPDPVSGILYLTPECKNGHALISFRESGMASAWRGDVWMVCTCRACSESFLVYLSTGRIPLLNCVGLTADEAKRAYRLEADIAVADVMLILGFASRPTPYDPTAKHKHRV